MNIYALRPPSNTYTNVTVRRSYCVVLRFLFSHFLSFTIHFLYVLRARTVSSTDNLSGQMDVRKMEGGKSCACQAAKAEMKIGWARGELSARVLFGTKNWVPQTWKYIPLAFRCTHQGGILWCQHRVNFHCFNSPTVAHNTHTFTATRYQRRWPGGCVTVSVCVCHYVLHVNKFMLITFDLSPVHCVGMHCIDIAYNNDNGGA